MKMMMKLLLAAGLVVGLNVQAGKVADNCGCGIGTMALGEEEGLLSHLAATFLNGISGNQTFGISSGTLGCDQATELVSLREVEVFVADNADQLILDAANGSGDYLAAVADLLMVAPAERDAFYTAIQSNFDSIFGQDDAAAIARSLADAV